MEEKYRAIKNYKGLKRGLIITEDWNSNLLACFRFLPSKEFSKLETFAGKPLLPRPAPADESPCVSETEICRTFRNYLYQSGYLEKISRCKND